MGPDLMIFSTHLYIMKADSWNWDSIESNIHLPGRRNSIESWSQHPGLWKDTEPSRLRPILLQGPTSSVPMKKWIKNARRMQTLAQCACTVTSTIWTIRHLARYWKGFVFPTSTILYMLHAWRLNASLETSPLPKRKHFTGRYQR